MSSPPSQVSILQRPATASVPSAPNPGSAPVASPIAATLTSRPLVTGPVRIAARPKLEVSSLPSNSSLLEHFTGYTLKEYLDPANAGAWAAVTSFVEKMVEVMGMRAYFRYASHLSSEAKFEQEQMLDVVLTYLHKLKVPLTSRHLGAFSFFTGLTMSARPLPKAARTEKGEKRAAPHPGHIAFYIDGQHFVHMHPEYARVFARFGGDMNQPISLSKPNGAKLSDFHDTPMIDVRQSSFTARILERYGPDAAHYFFPPPSGKEDFELIRAEDGAITEYISASLGPRMLVDRTAPVTEEDIPAILEQYRKCPEIANEMTFLLQAYPLLRKSYLAPELVREMAELVGDTIIVRAVDRYGAAYRIGTLSEPEIRQLLCIPSSLVMSDQVMEKFIVSVLSPETGELDMTKLRMRCRQITSTHILDQKFQLTFVCQQTCQMLVPKEVDYRDYSVADIFTYISGNTLHVVLTDQLPMIAVGVGKDLDEGIQDAAISRWEAIQTNGLMFPPRPIHEMDHILVAPEESMLSLL